jgi:hypothetical protein
MITDKTYSNASIVTGTTTYAIKISNLFTKYRPRHIEMAQHRPLESLSILLHY